MKETLVRITLLLTLILAVFGCADDDTYDKKKAVSALQDLDILIIDENLKNQKITTPLQKNLSFFDQSIINKNEIENFAFKPLKNKKNKFLTKNSSLWSSYKGFFSDRNVYNPIIIDKKIFLLDSSGILRAYNLETEKKIFKKRIFTKKYFKNYRNPKISHQDGVIFAIIGTNEIVAINSKNGNKIWSRKILSIPISAIATDKKKIYFLTNDNKVYALNSKNGKIEWTSVSSPRPTTIIGSAQPIINENQLIIGFSNGEISAFEKANGNLLWKNQLNQNHTINSDFYLSDVDATPVIKNNTIYASSNNGYLTAIQANGGQILWKKRISTISNFWLASGFIFTIDNQNRLICLSQKSGKIKYIKQLELLEDKDEPESKIIYISISMIGDKLIAADQLSNLTIINPQNGEIEQIYKTSDKLFHKPIVINGKIILHTLGTFTINLLKIW